LPASDLAGAARLGLNQPKVAALRNTRLEGFSVERLTGPPIARLWGARHASFFWLAFALGSFFG
jgi:hypothetical protein